MEQKAKEEMEKGEKSTKGGFLGGLFKGEEKHEKARDHFNLAGNYYKAQSLWLEAAQAYMRAQDMSVKLKNEMDAVEDLQNAATCYQKAKDPRAKEILERVIDTYVRTNKITQAYKLAQSMAESAEAEPDAKAAIHWYKKASDLMKRENSSRTAQQLQLRCANLYAMGGNYKDAIAIYDEIGKDYAADRLLKLGARQVLFMALLCHLVQIKPVAKDEGISAFLDVFHSYEDADPVFTSQTWEHILITKIVEAFEEDSMAKYSDAVSEYEDINPLDDLKSKLLMRIKDVLRKICQNEC